MSVEVAKELVEQFEELTARCAELSLAIQKMSQTNDYRKHLHCYVMIKQGSHEGTTVEVAEDVVRAHFELALENARKDLRQVEQRLALLAPSTVSEKP